MTKPLDLTPQQRNEAIVKTSKCLAEAAEVARNLKAVLEPSLLNNDSRIEEFPLQERLNITSAVLQAMGESALTENKDVKLVPAEQLRVHKAAFNNCMGR